MWAEAATGAGVVDAAVLAGDGPVPASATEFWTIFVVLFASVAVGETEGRGDGPTMAAAASPVDASGWSTATGAGTGAGSALEAAADAIADATVGSGCCCEGGWGCVPATGLAPSETTLWADTG